MVAFMPDPQTLLIVIAGIGAIFLVDAATFVLSAISLLMLRPTPVEARPTDSHFFADLAAGWHEVTSRRWILAAICAFGLLRAKTRPPAQGTVPAEPEAATEPEPAGA